MRERYKGREREKLQEHIYMLNVISKKSEVILVTFNPSAGFQYFSVGQEFNGREFYRLLKSQMYKSE